MRILVIEERDPLGVDRATALSILANDPGALTIFGDDRPWLEINTELGGHAYGVAAEAVRVIDAKIGRAGVVAMLDRLGAGTPPQAAIEDAIGEPPSRDSRSPSPDGRSVHTGRGSSSRPRDPTACGSGLPTGSGRKAASRSPPTGRVTMRSAS